MNKIFLLLVLFLFTWGCSKETKKPENVLSKETMVKVMADMTLSEAKIKSLRLPADSSRALYREYERAIFIERNVSPEQYQESYQYYLMNYDDMAAIQAAVIDTLELRRQKVVQ